MFSVEQNQIVALAALFQASNLVDRLASNGQIPPSAYETMKASLFKFTSDPQDIYRDDLSGSPVDVKQSLGIGFRVAKKILQDGNANEYAQTIRYAMAIIQLSKHFRKQQELQNHVGNSLKQLSERKSLESNEISNQAISELYLESLATLPFRIQVLGKMQYLQNPETEAQVRTLLFSGVRAALLWHQFGGRRWHFLFKKAKIISGLENF